MGPKENYMASIDDVLNLPQRRILMPTRNLIMDQHEQIINKFFDDFYGNRKNFIHSNTSYPKMDIIEDDTYFRIRCAVPGLYKEDLDIEIVKESKLLTIKGVAKDSGYDSPKFHYHLKELKNSAFTRTIQFPEYIDMEANPLVSLDNGILYMCFKKIVHKEEEPKETIKKISIK
jgi:HSP20 family molecular chaperone IbpA